MWRMTRRLLRARRRRRRLASQGDESIEVGPRGGIKTPFDRMGFLFQADSLTTKSPPRPFVGITDETQADLERVLKRDLLEFIPSTLIFKTEK